MESIMLWFLRLLVRALWQTAVERTATKARKGVFDGVTLIWRLCVLGISLKCQPPLGKTWDLMGVAAMHYECVWAWWCNINQQYGCCLLNHWTRPHEVKTLHVNFFNTRITARSNTKIIALKHNFRGNYLYSSFQKSTYSSQQVKRYVLWYYSTLDSFCEISTSCSFF